MKTIPRIIIRFADIDTYLEQYRIQDKINEKHKVQEIVDEMLEGLI